MSIYIVTEGQFDAELLTRLLAEEVREGVSIKAAGGKSGAQSLARSLVAARRRPVALVLDADTTDEASVHRQRLVARELLAMASPGIPTEVFMAVPSMEVLFFKDDALLRALLGRLIPGFGGNVNVADQGPYEPKRALQKILETLQEARRIWVKPGPPSLSDLVQGLTNADAARMSEYPPVSDIKHFIQSTALAQTVEV